MISSFSVAMVSMIKWKTMNQFLVFGEQYMTTDSIQLLRVKPWTFIKSVAWASSTSWRILFSEGRWIMWLSWWSVLVISNILFSAMNLQPSLPTPETPSKKVIWSQKQEAAARSTSEKRLSVPKAQICHTVFTKSTALKQELAKNWTKTRLKKKTPFCRPKLKNN